MKYPKKVISKFVQVAKYDCRQVNIHIGRKWAYIFIEPRKFSIKLPIAELDRILQIIGLEAFIITEIQKLVNTLPRTISGTY